MYLRPDVQIEPIFNQWYAWTQLVQPVTAAMNVANSHIRLMKSYIASPQVHAQALKNPAMSGGAFLDLGGKRVDEVKALLDETTSSSKDLIELAQAVKTLDELVRMEGTGYSLEGLYPKVPDALRGYVELVYDLNGAPRVRFLESLLYKSKYYDEKRQGFLLSITPGDDRPFILSTPRLADEAHLHARVPFCSDAIDDFVEARDRPRSPDELRERLGVGADRKPAFDALFTGEAPPPRARWEGPGVRVRYFGHACVLFQTRDVSILVDPLVSYRFPTEVARFTYDDLPEKIDYVLITHAHQDHVVFETLFQLRHRIGTVVVPRGAGGQLEDLSLRHALRAVGFPRVVELDDLDELPVPGGRVVGLPFLGEHGDLDVRTKLAHLVELEGRRFLCAADSNNIEPRLYDHVHEVYGDIETLFLGMECDGAPYSWLYGALTTRPIVRKNDQSRRLNGSDFARGKHIVERFGCKRVYVYAMGMEPWAGYISSIRYTPESRPIVDSNLLVAHCREQGIDAERLYCRKEMIV